MKYKMCASVAQKTPRSANTVLCKALKICDYAELRLDFLKPKDVPKALELSKRQLSRTVCTLRPKSEGGVFEGTEKERIVNNEINCRIQSVSFRHRILDDEEKSNVSKIHIKDKDRCALLVA